MTLTSTMQIAHSALTASQIGLQVTSQNLANAATPGYTRQIALLRTLQGQATDPFNIGSGVGIGEVRRQIDTAIQSRLWNSHSDEFSSAQRLTAFDQLETILSEGTEYDLSSELASLFNTWSEATTLLDSGSTILNQASSLSSYIRNMRDDLFAQRQQIESQIDAQARAADALFGELAAINETITTRENGEVEDSALRDRRDSIVTELSQIVDVTVSETPQGMYDVYVGSTPIVQGTASRGITIDRVSTDQGLTVRVAVGDNLDTLNVDSGSLGGLLSVRDGAVDETLERLDEIASSIIFEVNKLHSTGVNEDWITSSLGTLQIAAPNLTLPLNDPLNTDLAELPYAATNGGFTIHVRNGDFTDQVFIPVDLDGIDTLGNTSTADDTSAEDIRAALDAVDGINASFDPSGRLIIETEPGFSYGFSDDSSGALAVLGVNTLFEGTNARTIGVRDDVEVMIGRLDSDGNINANGTALLIGQLGDSAVDALAGQTINKHWSLHAQDIAVQAGAARTDAEASLIVRQNLDAQHAGVSGVSVDEESINMLTYQNQYQGAAQIIQTAQQMFETLIGLV